MRKVIHISDIHFGRTDPTVVEKLAEKLHDLDGDLLILSGDITQRARQREFRAARAFVDRFAMPKVAVPGNHDIPAHNLFLRFFDPLGKYNKYFRGKGEARYLDDEVAVIGVNTARSFVIKGGRINEEQVDDIKAMMCSLHDRMLKIVVTHHPFDSPDDDDVVGRADQLMPRIADCGADVFLAGHLHVSSITTSAHRYRLKSGQSALIIQAGTAASTRGRGEPNSFNLLEFEYPVLSVHRYECSEPNAGFMLATTERFTHTAAGWERM